MKRLYGMIAAMPTIFNKDESLDLEGIKKIAEHLVQGGIHGMTACGSTGEYSLMSMDERKKVYKAVAEQVNGRCTVIAGISCHRTADTVELVKAAGDAGADLALLLPPYYMQTTRQGIIDYYKEIAKNSEIGIVIYHYPMATGVTMPIDLIVELSKIDKIIGIKNTHDMEHTSKLIDAVKDDKDFDVINGFEHLIMGTLASGGSGTMGIIHNLVPRQMREIFDGFQNNDVKTAMEVNSKINKLYSLMEDEPCPGPLKAGLELLGLPGGNPRRPVVPASDEMRECLKAELKKIGLI